MSTKTTGAEFKRFYNDDAWWPQDDGNTYHDDELVLINGSEWEDGYEYVPDAAKVTIDGGMVFGPQWDGNEPSFEVYFKRWKKEHNTEFFNVEAPKDKVEAIKAAIKAAGGKVS